ncbi:MAG: phycocyanobilin:ferredoxin oxidoreductase [cyanobacterium endosymbiont of Rhopalodia sterrenbergii]
MLDTSPVSVRFQLNSLIRLLADVIQCHWEQYFPLIFYELSDGLGHVAGKLGRKEVVIENQCYKTLQFRKLYLEFAKVGQELNILHRVIFPHSSYSLSMFDCDIVATPRRVSSRLAGDKSANRELTLSSENPQALSKSPVLMISRPRRLPEWGDVLSDYCLFIRSTDPKEEIQFLSRGAKFLKIHCQTTVDYKTVSSKQQMSNLAGQHYFYKKQQQKDKKHRVLGKIFGKKWANKYITQVLFYLPNQDK